MLNLYSTLFFAIDINYRFLNLVLVALKHHHLTESVLKDIIPLTGPDTIGLSVMNGLESKKLLGHACGQEKIVPAIGVGIDAVHKKKKNRFTNPGLKKITAGEVI
nr:2-dehydropantoate 2-reductase N-terminal domain-containing protein [uncultured Desulfobacter sp.]